MKKIYLFVSTSLFLLFGGITSCDDNSLSNDEVYIPDPVVISDEDDGLSPEPTTESVIRILPEGKHQEIDGFGCNFGWAEAVYGCTKREQIMDDLYGEDGLRFNVYRGEVCASSASADGKTFNFKTQENYHLGAHSSEAKTLYKTDEDKFKEYAQLWIIDYLCKKKRMDIYYFFSVWTPPIVWKSFSEGEEQNGGSGSFNSEYSKEYADFLSSFAKAFKDKFGINVYGISGWNEPDQAMGGWDGCIWGNQQMADFTMNNLRPALNEKGLKDTKIIYGELPWWANAVTWVENALRDNPGLVDANIVAAGHGYSTVDDNILPMKAAQEKGIHVWQTETCDDKTRDETWNDAMKWAKNYSDYLTKANTSAVVWWAGARQCSTTGENLLQTNAYDFSDNFYRVDRYYSIGQFSRYIQRGSTRVDVKTVSTTANRIPKELSASAYIKDDTYTIVLVNKSQTKGFDALLEIDGKEFDSMISYTSNSSVKWMRKKLNPSSSGKRSVTVPKYSVVTITGRFK
ncbi:glycoside hydrolase family 30 beta sandwich domain-containing protein [uncultured Bacteroides sp.]|uniref:glycoside hydrolase family 30 beta sandwich domain-containing protein n=1 Tax=uncultured Bacteroides sp. TaxID=162156 RepID=UPI0025E647B8|nr:glycoside hydrolase family 30 beta sandwich domain-containing protein [uncultured Bacteroides sp.]